MKKKRLLLTLAIGLILISAFALFKQGNILKKEQQIGSLIIKVNPEISISYDSEGKIIDVTPINDDGKELLKDYNEYENKHSRTVIKDIIKLMSDKGYL